MAQSLNFFPGGSVALTAAYDPAVYNKLVPFFWFWAGPVVFVEHYKKNVKNTELVQFAITGNTLFMGVFYDLDD